MDIEYKTVGVTGVMDTSDKDGPGVVTAIVSVTGIKDNVNDVIEPGAYADSLLEITPKGAWHHDWTVPVSKTLLAKELMPGDRMLPTKLPNGQPWPKDAGALMIKMQFNLDTQRGREAHSDVLFFGDQQEWSIGYKVADGGARYVKDAAGGQTRYISKLRCYEYSPVLFGAMPAARTASIKDAQLSFKSLMGQDLSSFLAQLADLESAAGLRSAGIESKNTVRGYSKPSTGRMTETDEDDDEYEYAEDEGKELTEAEVKAGWHWVNRLGKRFKRRSRREKYEQARDRFYDEASRGVPSMRSTNRLGMAAYRYLKSDDADYDDEDMDLEDLEDDEMKAALMSQGITANDLRTAITVMSKVLDIISEAKDGDTAVVDLDSAIDSAIIELEALDYDNTGDATASISGLSPDQRVTLAELATQFDSSDAADDDAREALLDAIEEELDSQEAQNEATYDGLRVLARVAGDRAELADGEKSSRFFGPEYKGLVGVGREQRRTMYLTELKAQRPEVFEGLMARYDISASSDHDIERKSEPAEGEVSISLKDLEELSALTQS